MKVLKRAEQKNFRIAKDMYTEWTLKEMLNNQVIYWLDEDLEQHSDLPEWWKFKDTEFIIFAEDCEEIKVVYHKEWGFYTNIVTTKTGKEIYIEL